MRRGGVGGMDAAKNTASAPRVERKFYLPPGRVDLAYAALRQACRADASYPEGRVTSLYFDTFDLESYYASASGDWERHKVRLRWYGEGDEETSAAVFLERKTRQGMSSTKQRRMFSAPAERLRQARLSTGVIDRRTLVDTLAEMGHHAGERLRPIVAVSYRRRRLVEMLTGVRVSIDSEITSTLVAEDIGAGAFDVRLPGGVLEVKGPDTELPPSLRRIGMLDTGWSRFSKYCQCLGTHLFETEAVGGRWPSGVWPENSG